MNLAEWADSQGIAHATAYRWFKAGKLPLPARKVGGLILVDVPDNAPKGQTVVYARVSSADQKPDLDRQVARVTAWATSQEISVDRVVTEVGSALNGHRRKFLSRLTATTPASARSAASRMRFTVLWVVPQIAAAPRKVPASL